MARLAGVNIPDEKRSVIALTYIYGIGLTKSKQILEMTKIDESKRAKDLTTEEIGKLREVLEKDFIVEGALRKERMMNVKHMRDVGTYRGMRHSRKLPVHGQRTKSNSRTVRGNSRNTMGSGRRKVDKK